MEQTKPTLGIYGIQDRVSSTFPQYVHDHNIALLENGVVKNFVQLERITRQKHDNKLHLHLPELISKMGLIEADLDVVFVDNVIGRAFISSDGQIRFEAPLNRRLTKTWEEGRLWWFNRELNAYVLNHELAHVFSCLPFFGEFEENSLLVHFDGGASLSNFSAWIFRMGKIIPVEHHWELKNLTNLYNANALTFGIIGNKTHNRKSVARKLMEFAALGNYNEDIDFWLRQHKWFEGIEGNYSLFFERVKADFNIDLKSFDQHNRFLQDVIASIQEIFMRETLMKIDDVNTLSNCKNLYYTGSNALNINTNSAIIESGLFNKVYIPPCSDDSGLALGAAAFGEWMKGNKLKQHTPFLNNWGIYTETCEYTTADLQEIAKLLIEEKVIGICNGSGEAGPRALGNRSLIALPTKAISKKVSIDHKKQEWYQPIAAVMLEKNARYYTGLVNINHLSKYMLLDFPIDPIRQSEIPGVIHANGAARFQTIFKREENPFLYDLLNLLDNEHHIKALINTSFNQQGEPIVHTCNDALDAAKKMKLDAVVLNGKLQLLNYTLL